MENKKAEVPQHVIDYIKDMSIGDDFILSDDDVESFKSVADESDVSFITKIMSRCVMWEIRKERDPRFDDIITKQKHKIFKRIEHKIKK